MTGRQISLRRVAAVALGVVGALASVARVSAADTLTPLYNFTESEEGRPPSSNTPLVQDAAGNLYGTTFGDYAVTNSYGTVFRLAPDGTLTTLHRFDYADDRANPSAALALARDGNLYGTTPGGGGPYNAGTVFRLTPEGTLTTLHVFNGTTDGGVPRGGLVEGNDGSLYGAALFGGENSAGTFFRITTAGAFTVLHSFGGEEGPAPGSALVQAADGNFYGTNSGGGPGEEDFGGVFQVTPGGQATRLHRFVNTSDGTYPGPLLVGHDGNLYGVTYGGGPDDGEGTVFRLGLDGTFAFLHTFTRNAAGNDPDGDGPETGLVEDGGGNLYGTTSEGWDNDGSAIVGTVFRLAPDGTLTTLHKFSGYLGEGSAGTPILGRDGSLYGVALSGGTNEEAFVYRVTTDSVAPTVAPPPASTLPEVDGALIGGDTIADTQAAQFQLAVFPVQTSDLKVAYQIKGTGVPGVDYLPLKGTAKIKAGRQYKSINLFPIGIAKGAGTRSVRTVKLTILPSDGYKLNPAETPLKIKIVHP